MGEVEAIYRIWLREIIRYTRDKGRVLSSFVQPLLFLAIFGSGFGFISLEKGIDYQSFLFPGIVAMSLVTISISSGISVIWDREFGFLKEILVAPVKRTSIFIGKTLGGCTTAMIQGIVILSLSVVIGIPVTIASFVTSLALMMLISLGIVSLGLIIASLVHSFENFGVIMNFLIFPLVFLSGAFFPLSMAPVWLRTVSYIDPLTYGVEALRYALIGASFIPFTTSLLVMVVISACLIVMGGIAFNRQK